MSFYYRRRLRPECALPILIGKLLGNHSIETANRYTFILKKTGHQISVSPQWITESA